MIICIIHYIGNRLCKYYIKIIDINKRLYEYKKDLLKYKILNILVYHRNEPEYNFKLKNPTLFKSETSNKIV